MSSPEPPLPLPEDDALDAAASAVVDGVATPEEAALVASAAQGQARVDAFRAVAGAVGQPVPEQDPGAAARALAAALDAFAGSAAGAEPAIPASGADGGGAGAAGEPAGGSGHQATVTPLAPPRSGSTPRWLPRLGLVAAALLLVVALGAVVIGVLGGNESANMASDSQAAAPAPPTTAGVETFAAPAAPAPAAGATTDAAAPSPTSTLGSRAMGPVATAPAPQAPVVDGGDVGSQTEVDALVQRVAAALDSPPDPATATAASALPTDVQACVSAGPSAAGQVVGDLRYRAVGTFRDAPAVVLAYDRPGTRDRLLLVLARNGCRRLASTPF